MTKIGANIKKIRTTKGLSQQAFAELFDLTRGNISSYEDNRAEPRIEMLVRIANYFCIPVDKFIQDQLTINEILQFNSDKLLTEEPAGPRIRLREVPFLSDDTYEKCQYGDLGFNDWAAFPKLMLPGTIHQNLAALAFNRNIPYHISVPPYQVNDVLVFEEVNQGNIHLCDGKTGLFATEREIMIGRFEAADGIIHLVLNDFKRQRFDFTDSLTFWKLFATYEYVK